MKNQVGSINATPVKRLFFSVIADYDLNKSICELVDNTIDIWTLNGRKSDLQVTITLHLDQQRITVIDNVGGLSKENLGLIVTPGLTNADPDSPQIGIFGVGSKRAVVALSEDITIASRKGEQKTYSIEVTDDWLKDDDWNLPYYEVDDIEPGTTIVEMSRLRTELTKGSIVELRDHLGSVYSQFLRSRKFRLLLNGYAVEAIDFENWAYPPSYPPRSYRANIPTEDGKKVGVTFKVGLTRESSPTGEYGIYFYCNGRLIGRALKDQVLGFAAGEIGLPHPSFSLLRAIVMLKGPASMMPWNSSKSGINPNNSVLLSLRSFLIPTVKYYASLSKRWVGRWEDEVFKYPTGKFVYENVGNLTTARRTRLPPLPRIRQNYTTKVIELNKSVRKSKPWVQGLYEGIIAVEAIDRLNIEQKNRIALILIDSTLEIGFKEYLVYDSGGTYSNAVLLKLFNNRKDVHSEIDKYVHFGAKTWAKVGYYYNLRCSLIHQRAAAGITTDMVREYRQIVQRILSRLFGLKF